MKKLFFAFIILVSSFSFLVSPVLAEDEVRKLMLDLKVKGFSQTVWQDNLSSSNIIFAPGDKFQVQVKIRNEGNRNQTQVKVRQTLPSTVTSDSPVEFTIPQISAGQDYVKDITVTVKNKTDVYKALTNNSLRFTAKSEVGTESSDFAAFYTSNGTKDIAKSNTPVLPKTGAASTLIFGSAIAAVLAIAGLKLRQAVRGY
ncbi:LPXTG cell wall anchor domain-containing protein [Candidatus Shapirobacteria bacterium]|nr:LPXTG cell wall anchor domain-containing protein [Candidatus Shapirobacteria bacterium]